MKPLSQRLALAHPVQVDSGGNGRGFDPNFLGPIAEVLRSPVMRKQAGTAAVPYLLLSRGPLAIFRRVADVVVDSLKGKTWRALTHVCEEVFKRVYPAVADGNPPTSVSSVPFVLGVKAPALHVPPRLVCSRSFTHSRVSVGGVVGAGKLTSIAPAGFNEAGDQRRSGYDFLRTAVAQAEPSAVFTFFGQSLNHKSSETCAYEGGVVGSHASNYSTRTVDDKWQHERGESDDRRNS